MTELPESAINTQIAEYLTHAGWEVIVFAQDRAVRRQMSGWVDIAAFKDDVTLLVECKTRKGRVRASQDRLFTRLMPHTGTHLWHVLARDLDTLVEVVGMVEAGR